MSKNLRQTKILNLVRAYPILSQLELARQLKAAGLTATQATLSRDLRELNLIKTTQGYRPPDALGSVEGNHNQQRHTISQFVTEVAAAGNLVVVKTNPGNASPVARALDTIGWREIVGTVAGDDTILVVTPDQPKARLVRKRLMELAG
jgi:transcriptional regulator of arginine metabolism